MATTTKPNRYPTMTDLMDRLDPDGEMADVVEVLNETNEMLEDIVWEEANNKLSHKTTVRSGLPSVIWRKLNYGVPPSKSKTKQITDTCGMLESLAVIDKKLAAINGMKESWRASEEAPFVEAMSQEFQRALLYGDSSKDPEKIMGFMPRFSTITASKAENAVNVISAGGTGSKLASILLVGWGKKTVHGIFPEGTKVGLDKTDLGEEPARDEDGNEFRALKTQFEWDVGLTVRDWRYVVRICNISQTKLTKDPDDAAGVDLITLMVKALARVPSLSNARFAFYCNREIETYLRLQMKNTKNVHLSLDEAAGRPVLRFDGIPIRRVDAMGFAEAQVS